MALRLHPRMLATGQPEFPTRVVALGSNPVHTDKQARPSAPEPDVPEQIELIAEFAIGLHFLMTTSTINYVPSSQRRLLVRRAEPENHYGIGWPGA